MKQSKKQKADKMKAKLLDVTPTQAIGIALSCTPSMTTVLMGDCQEEAVGIVDHLNRMGFRVVHLDDLPVKLED